MPSLLPFRSSLALMATAFVLAALGPRDAGGSVDRAVPHRRRPRRARQPRRPRPRPQRPDRARRQQPDLYGRAHRRHRGSDGRRRIDRRGPRARRADRHRRDVRGRRARLRRRPGSAAAPRTRTARAAQRRAVVLRLPRRARRRHRRRGRRGPLRGGARRARRAGANRAGRARSPRCGRSSGRSRASSRCVRPPPPLPLPLPRAATRCASSSRSRCSAPRAGVRPTAATTVNWYRNTDRPHPLTSGNIDTEVTTAAAAWTNPTTASLILANAGTRSAGGSTDVFCTSINAGAGLISFEDPRGGRRVGRARGRRLLRQRADDDGQRHRTSRASRTATWCSTRPRRSARPTVSPRASRAC